MGLPGVLYDVAVKCTNKYEMRKAFQENSVPSPAFRKFSELDSFCDKVVNKIGFPCVIKPVDSMGARGVVKINNLEDLIKAFSSSIEYSRSREVIIEEYMQGPEYSIDSIFIDGKLKFISIADRHIYFSPYFVELGHTVPANISLSQKAELIEVFVKAVKALGIVNGQAKGDIKITPHGVKIGEIAARMSGSFNSGWTVPFATGINIHEASLMMAVGESPGDLSYDWNEQKGAAERTIISIPGKIKKIYGIDDAKSTNGNKVVYFWKKEGDEVDFPINNMGKCGCVVNKLYNAQMASIIANIARKKIFIRLEPNNKKTEDFLFDKDNLKFISAFREAATDCYGRDVQDALEKVSEHTGMILHGLLKVKNFWRCFLKGGVQGGVYIIDSMKKGLPK